MGSSKSHALRYNSRQPMHRLSATVIIVASLCAPMFAQPQTGELRLLVRDPTGSAVRASGVISSDFTHVERRFPTDDNGSFIAQSLPFGLYRVSIEQPVSRPTRQS